MTYFEKSFHIPRYLDLSDFEKDFLIQSINVLRYIGWIKIS